MGEGQQDPLHAQLPGPPLGDPAKRDIGTPVRRAGHLDVPPPDPPGRFTSLQRLVDRFLRRQADSDMLGGVGPGAAVLGFGGGEETIEDVRAFVGEHRPRARHFDEINAYSDRAHRAGRATKSRRRYRSPSTSTIMMYAPFTTRRAPPPMVRSQTYSLADAATVVWYNCSPVKLNTDRRASPAPVPGGHEITT